MGKLINYHDLLNSSSAISDAQYAYCREAGFTPEEIEGHDSNFIKQLEPWIFPADPSTAPASAKQYQWLAQSVDFAGVPIEKLSYADARKLIAKLLYADGQGEDERYNHAIHLRFQNAKARKGGMVQ